MVRQVNFRSMQNLSFLLMALVFPVAGVNALYAEGLPPGYQEFEYCTSCARAIKTGYTPVSTDRVEMKFLLGDTYPGRGIFSARAGYSDGTYTCYFNGGSSSKSNLRYDFAKGGAMNSPSVIVPTKDYELVYDGGFGTATLSGNGTNVVTTMSSVATNFTAGSELYLFAIQTAGTVDATKSKTWMRCYYFRIYGLDGALKMNLVPCRETSTQKAGMYDTVGRKFLEPTVIENTGASSTGFSLANEVRSADAEDLYELAYIETTTNTWLHTGLTPECDDQAEMKVRFVNESITTHVLWSTRDTSSSSNPRRYMSLVNTSGWRMDFSNKSGNATLNGSTKKMEPNVDYTLRYVGETAKGWLNGTQYDVVQNGTVIAPQNPYDPAGPLALFACSDVGANLTSSTDVSYRSKYRCYYFRLLDKDGALKMNLIPCSNAVNNVVGMYDTVTRKFFAPIAIAGQRADCAFVAGPVVGALGSLSCAVNAEGGKATVSAAASSVARAVVLATGDADLGPALQDWGAQTVFAGTLAAGATSVEVDLPAGFGTGYQVVRAFAGEALGSEPRFFVRTVTMTKIDKVDRKPVSADLAFAGSSAARRLFVVWGRKDLGETLSGWTGRAEIAGGIPAGVTAMTVALPEETKAFLSESSGGFRFIVADVATARDYVRKNLCLQYDGIENAGFGRHDPMARRWKDLVADNDLSLAEIELSAKDGKTPTKRNDGVAAMSVQIGRVEHTTPAAIMDSAVDNNITIEANMSLKAYEGTAFAPCLRILTYGYIGWDVHGNGSVICQRPVSAAFKDNDKPLLRNYDWGFADLKQLISEGAYHTYSFTPGYGNASAADSALYWDGVEQARNTSGKNELSGAMSHGMALSVGYIKSVTSARSIRVYNRELTKAERDWNLAVDRERFDGGDPTSFQSSPFQPFLNGLTIVIR